MTENVINDLVYYKDLKIIQNKSFFNFSLDSVLLPNFVTINTNVKKIIDLGCGNAPMPLILSTRTSALITGIELQKEIFDLATETVKMNKLEDQIEIINMDIKDVKNTFESDTFDVIVCNPPYFKTFDQTKINDNEVKAIARHELKITLDEIFEVSKKILKNNGVIAMVHRTERLPEIISLMIKHNIQPKRMQFIHPKENTESELFLIEGRKNGNAGLKILKPIIVHNEDGGYTDEINKIFGGE